MPDRVLMDNDVVLKTCCYNAVEEVLGCTAGNARTIHVLGALRFVLAKAISRAKNIVDKAGTSDRLARLLDRVELIEPEGEELALAADFEAAAQSLNVELHDGESQLLAVLIMRSAAVLLTGDKRAIRAMEPIVEAVGYTEHVSHRVACLEQIVMTLVGRHGAETIHRRVCREAAIDKSLANCFSCTSGFCRQESILDGLRSYIADLRRDAPRVLVDSDDLSTVVPQEDGVG
jgi:hypothetical protein